MGREISAASRTILPRPCVTPRRACGTSARRCRRADPAAWRSSGLERLDVFLPEVSSQRNGAGLLVRTTRTSLPDDFGPDLELLVESGGEAWSDVATLKAGSGRFSYAHKQSDP